MYIYSISQHWQSGQSRHRGYGRQSLARLFELLRTGQEPEVLGCGATRGDAGRRGAGEKRNGPQKSGGFSRFLGFSSFSLFLFIFRINSNAIHSRYTPISGHTHMVVWFCSVFLSSDPESHPKVGFESVSGFGFRVSSLETNFRCRFRVSGFGFRVSSLETHFRCRFRVSGFDRPWGS